MVVLDAHSRFATLAPRLDTPDDFRDHLAVQSAIHALINEARGTSPFGPAIVFFHAPNTPNSDLSRAQDSSGTFVLDWLHDGRQHMDVRDVAL